MRDAGASLRQIAATAGVGYGTVSRSLSDPGGSDVDHGPEAEYRAALADWKAICAAQGAPPRTIQIPATADECARRFGRLFEESVTRNCAYARLFLADLNRRRGVDILRLVDEWRALADHFRRFADGVVMDEIKDRTVIRMLQILNEFGIVDANEILADGWATDEYVEWLRIALLPDRLPAVISDERALHIPADLPDDVHGAAIAYAAAGWYVGPARMGPNDRARVARLWNGAVLLRRGEESKAAALLAQRSR